jgi:hypothetical protein
MSSVLPLLFNLFPTAKRLKDVSIEGLGGSINKPGLLKEGSLTNDPT